MKSVSISLIVILSTYNFYLFKQNIELINQISVLTDELEIVKTELHKLSENQSQLNEIIFDYKHENKKLRNKNNGIMFLHLSGAVLLLVTSACVAKGTMTLISNIKFVSPIEGISNIIQKVILISLKRFKLNYETEITSVTKDGVKFKIQYFTDNTIQIFINACGKEWTTIESHMTELSIDNSVMIANDIVNVIGSAGGSNMVITAGVAAASLISNDESYDFLKDIH